MSRRVVAEVWRLIGQPSFRIGASAIYVRDDRGQRCALTVRGLAVLLWHALHDGGWTLNGVWTPDAPDFYEPARLEPPSIQMEPLGP